MVSPATYHHHERPSCSRTRSRSEGRAGTDSTVVLVDNSRLGRRWSDASRVEDVVPLAIVTDLWPGLLFEAPWIDVASWVLRRDGSSTKGAIYLKGRDR